MKTGDAWKLIPTFAHATHFAASPFRLFRSISGRNCRLLRNVLGEDRLARRPRERFFRAARRMAHPEASVDPPPAPEAASGASESAGARTPSPTPSEISLQRKEVVHGVVSRALETVVGSPADAPAEEMHRSETEQSLLRKDLVHDMVEAAVNRAVESRSTSEEAAMHRSDTEQSLLRKEVVRDVVDSAVANVSASDRPPAPPTPDTDPSARASSSKASSPKAPSPKASSSLKATSPKAPPPRARPRRPSTQRSQFGAMVDSQKRTAPSASFGSALRFEFQRANQPAPGSAQHATLRRSASRTADDPSRRWNPPGPGAYKALPSIGRQSHGERRSCPALSLGRAGRFSAAEREGKTRVGPSPAQYALASGFGRQSESRMDTLPSVSFTRAPRRVGRATPAELDSVGPAVYEAEKMFGPQLLSGRATAPKHAFTRELRATDRSKKNPEEIRTGSVPGPGAYLAPAGIGDQLLSTRRNVPVISFGTCYRGQAARSSLGKLQAKAALGGYLGPGPAYNPAPGAVDAQVHSGKANAPKVGFPMSPRDAGVRADDDEPGPGSYVV